VFWSPRLLYGSFVVTSIDYAIPTSFWRTHVATVAYLLSYKVDDRQLGAGGSLLATGSRTSSTRPAISSAYTSSLDRYAGRSTDYSGRLGSAYSSDLDLSRPSTGASSRSYGRTSSYTPSVGRASSPVWSSSRTTRPDYRSVRMLSVMLNTFQEAKVIWWRLTCQCHCQYKFKGWP